jgi:hypothetical protein
MECIIIPVIIGATGVVTKDLKKSEETTTGYYSVDSLKRQLNLECDAQFSKYWCLKLEA